MNTALRDINGIDSVGWFPPGPGWWVLAIALVLLFYLIRRNWTTLLAWYRRPRALWRRDARRQLNTLRKRLETADQKTLAAELSELIRRIAVARCGRETCAGLSGREWLEWLTDNDPGSFDWNEHGELLQELTYAPPMEEDHRPKFEQMIKAAHIWTESSCRGQADA